MISSHSDIILTKKEKAVKVLKWKKWDHASSWDVSCLHTDNWLSTIIPFFLLFFISVWFKIGNYWPSWCCRYWMGLSTLHEHHQKTKIPVRWRWMGSLNFVIRQLLMKDCRLYDLRKSPTFFSFAFLIIYMFLFSILKLLYDFIYINANYCLKMINHRY